MEIGNWKEALLDRDRWRQIGSVAKIHETEKKKRKDFV